MKTDNPLIKNLKTYKQIELSCEKNIQFFLNKHSTKEGTWGSLQLQSGAIDFVFLDGKENEVSRQQMNAKNSSLIIPPGSWHKIIMKTPNFKAILSFCCQPHRYFEKKYGLSSIHHDLWHVYQTYLKQQKKMSMLDIGCGQGRNPLVFALSKHQVTGIDINQDAIGKIHQIASQEQLSNISAKIHDLNEELPFNKDEEQFDFIYSTVSLQFLQPQRIQRLLIELQTLTAKGGMHFLVFPIKAEPYYYPETFTYLAQKKELYQFYQDQGWSIIEYSEKPGQLHKLDNEGKPMQGIFGLLLAQNRL